MAHMSMWMEVPMRGEFSTREITCCFACSMCSRECPSLLVARLQTTRWRYCHATAACSSPFVTGIGKAQKRASLATRAGTRY